MDQARPPIVLTLVFSEPVDVGALNHTALVFQSNATAATSAESYRLQHAPAAVVPSSSQRQVAIELATGDFLALRDAAGLAVLMRSAATTYLRFDPVLVTDTIGSSVVGVSVNSSAVAPSEYTVDLVPPQLSAFDVDMDAGFVVLRFSEDVNASSIAVGAFSLVAARGANVTAEGVTFDAALDAASSTGNATQVRIDLSVSTLNRVKADAGLAVSRSTSFLAVAAGGIADFAGNSMRQVASASAVAAVSYVADATGPVLQSFALNMTSGVLRLTFDEVVARATFDATQARLVNAATGATVAVALDAVAVDAPAANSTTLGFTLTQAAANDVRTQAGLGTTVDNTYLQLLAGAIRDAAGNANLPVTANATEVVQDSTPARLLALSLNMDSGVLSLSYSEPVQALTLVPAAITLARAANSTSTYTLAHSTVVTSGYTQVVDVALGAEDITALKLAGICLFQDACAVSANGTLVQDATGAFVPAVADAEINDVFVADQTAPALADRGFLYFDLNNGTIALSFTEVVNVTSARPTRITLQSFFESPEASYTLTGGRVLGGYHSGPGSTVVLIALSTSDLNAVKSNPDICRARSTCYLSATAGVVDDLNANSAHPISETEPFVAAQAFVTDTTAPGLVSFGIDIEAGTVALTLDESIDSVSLHATGMTLQTAMWAKRGRQALAFVADTAAPALVSFDFNLTAGDLALTFSEPVNASTGDFARIQLRAAANATDAALTLSLTGGALTQSADDRVLYVRMTAADFLALQAKRALATNASTTFVFVDGLLDDYFGNTLAAADATAQQVAVFGEDTRAPTLVSVSLDLDARTMSMVFSEVLVGPGLPTVGITLLASPGSSAGVRLDIGERLVVSGTHATLSIAAAEASAIQAQAGVVSNDTAFVSLEAGVVLDLSANPSTAIASVDARAVLAFTADTTAPALTSFTLDMDAGVLNLTFSEPINTTSVAVPRFVVVREAGAAPVANVTLAASAVLSSQLGRQLAHVSVVLARADLDALKLDASLATAANSTRLVVLPNAATDTAGNAVVEVPVASARAVAAYTADTTSPELTAFDLNMTSGELVLEFSEPVLASSLDLSALVLANDTDAAFAVRTALDNGTASAVDGTQLRITLSVSVVDAIKLAANTAQAAAATFLDASGALVADMAGQPSVAVAALPVRVLAPDAVAPVLVSYGVRMDQARPPIVLTLVFSEPVDVGALNHTALVFQSNATAATSAESYRLQHAPAAVVPSSSQRQVAIELATGDFLALRDAAGLAVLMRSAATTYLRFDPVLVTDTIGSSVVGVSVNRRRCGSERVHG
ncbi:hypothetical protein PTSG_11402 [Salpingoeca rosetta]|uniref:Uncharacterized protein n=1 Tax=Salpingoeca rosetta (strain ATCC 50818 / BSB-021) TaxID=946362 RepID=F2UTF7_SALR5|nr:uncharacterized protein PTSG_11402 [Salpingoeca rosetta]EGD82839.1 hypothetical protein PTSG_11402 [Salpingoeca rosetta]|eukprot:XP_004987546.1 hypothetical protein PTSG_11402 [Salpingoeca rosetta]